MQISDSFVAVAHSVEHHGNACHTGCNINVWRFLYLFIVNVYYMLLLSFCIMNFPFSVFFVSHLTARCRFSLFLSRVGTILRLSQLVRILQCWQSTARRTAELYVGNESWQLHTRVAILTANMVISRFICPHSSEQILNCRSRFRCWSCQLPRSVCRARKRDRFSSKRD